MTYSREQTQALRIALRVDVLASEHCLRDALDRATAMAIDDPAYGYVAEALEVALLKTQSAVELSAVDEVGADA
jgi:hypothetical protein